MRSALIFFTPIIALFSACQGPAAPVATATAPASSPTPPHIYMIGDSTMSDKPLTPPQPERGWGQLLPLYFQPSVPILDFAVNGRSTKSFIDEGRWARVLAVLKSGDWVIIQFGHNDEKKSDPKRFTDPTTTFRDNLRRFVRETRAAGASPVLATPIIRRKFDAAGKLVATHGAYPDAVRAVAAEESVPLLELTSLTHDLVESYGPEDSKKLYHFISSREYASLPKGREDNTHLSAYGASRVSELAVAEIRRLKLPLVAWLRENPNLSAVPAEQKPQ